MKFRRIAWIRGTGPPRRNGEVLDRIEAHLRQLEEAFVRLENLKTEEQKLAAALDATCIEEKKILSDESASEKQATERLLKCRALRDIQAARVNNARTRTAIQIEDALEFGQTVRRNCVHFGRCPAPSAAEPALKVRQRFLGS